MSAPANLTTPYAAASSQAVAGTVATASNQRSCALDFLRAVAIGSVVLFHLVQMAPTPLPGFLRFATVGKYGVDLFFVLSGWLIGNLYWREYTRFGQVDLLRFWSRRWLRTIPPYLVMLALAWLAVAYERREAFDFGYLCFIQNYYERIPFFLVSWSLCIEEHFYLFLPLLLMFGRQSRLSVAVLFGALILVAPIWRCFMVPEATDQSFGFYLTATHLRMEGLLLGFWASYLVTLQPRAWSIVKRVSPWVVTFCGVGLALLCFLPDPWMYRVGLTVLALGLCGVLVFMADRKPGVIIGSRWVQWVALASYSVYLVHPLMLHAARKIAVAIPVWQTVAYFPIAIVFIIGAGAGFYFAIERTSIQLRDRWAPRRVGPSKSAKAVQ